ncbi:hypothetical protein IJ472_03900 [bacterium]|nr:hypothetical protein [bacterium]
MSKYTEQSLSGDSNITFNIDEEDDIYLPDDLLSELKFIFFMLRYIIQHPSERTKEWNNLQRQIRFYLRWMKIK